MISPEIKSKINKIDFDLKQLFENVYITEKSYKQFFFEIVANGTFFNLKESQSWKRAEVRVIINKTDLLSSDIRWSYSVNPLHESSEWLDRVSDVDNIASHIYEIITEQRMNEDYFLNLETLVEVINEGHVIESNIEEPVKSEVDLMQELVSSYGIDVAKVETDTVAILENNQFMTSIADRITNFHHNSDIKLSDRFKLESEMNSRPGVNYTVIKEGSVEVNWTPQS